MTWISTLSSIGMAVGPPLVYADQAISIVRHKDSSGFSRDVCAILLIANIARCFFWLGNRFEFPLLIQSILMILAQLALLYICIRYRPDISPESVGVSARPYGFWQWSSYGTYIEFLAGLMTPSIYNTRLVTRPTMAGSVVLTIVELIFGRMSWFVDSLGFFALGLESTLPLPQLYRILLSYNLKMVALEPHDPTLTKTHVARNSNYRQKSLHGFRMSTLLGWVGGDAYKTVYFFLQSSPLQFKVCAIFQLSVDFAIVAQRIYYGNKPPAILPDIDDIEQALRLAED